MSTYLNGIDISKWQPTTPSLAGLSFAFARATYATTVDPKYAMHVANFRRAGLVVGAYHFGVGHKTVAAQVKAFLTAAKGADLYILDLERDSTKTMTQGEAREFIRLVHAAGEKIGLYHSRSGFPELGQDYNWVAQWRSSPPTGIKWSFWQWQGSPLDRDKFNGDKAALYALAGRTPPATPAKEEPVAENPNIRLLDAVIDRAEYAKNEINAGTATDALVHLVKINQFTGRVLTSIAGVQLDDTELSDLPGIAVHQLLAATGHPTTIGETEPGIPGVLAPTPESVIADATPEQQRELALLGFFGHIGTRSDVDYSLRERYFHINDKGVEVLTSDTADTLTSENYWAQYLASKG